MHNNVGPLFGRTHVLLVVCVLVLFASRWFLSSIPYFHRVGLDIVVTGEQVLFSSGTTRFAGHTVSLEKPIKYINFRRLAQRHTSKAAKTFNKEARRAIHVQI